MDIDVLEQAHTEYKLMNARQLMLKAVMPNAEYLELRKTLSESLSEDEVDKAIDRMVLSSKTETAERLRTLMGDTTAYKINKACGISDRSINSMLSMERPASKYLMFALCLFFELPYRDAVKLLYQCGYSFSSEIPDVLIQSFLKEEKYTVGDWVDAVIAAYDAGGESAPTFFDGGFANGTISDIRKSKQ